MRVPEWSVGLLCLLMVACKPATPEAVPPPPAPAACAELDSLFQVLGEMDSVLLAGAPWADCQPYLQASVEALARNQRKGNADCNYLDQRLRPDEPRLLWVESLRSRIEEDTLPEGIYYLLRCMGVFKGDPEISEFFSEELSYVAMGNPACYWGYIAENPDQEVMLLYSTKWNAMDLDTLVARFDRLQGATPVVTFLRNLQENGDHLPQ